MGVVKDFVSNPIKASTNLAVDATKALAPAALNALNPATNLTTAGVNGLINVKSVGDKVGGVIDKVGDKIGGVFDNLGGGGGGGNNQPAAPDYVGAAKATAAGNLDAARAAAGANRVNQYTPFGNLIYSHDPSQGPDNGWSATQTLSPMEQAKLDENNKLNLSFLNTAQKGMGAVDSLLSGGGLLDESRLAKAPISGQTVQDAIMSRLQPQMERNQEALRTRLANQGLMEGSQGYKQAMEAQGQQHNDLYTQAALQGINTALGARQQGIQEQYAQQNRPLEILNALRSGTQPQSPTFTNVPQQATTQGADLLQAAIARGQYDSGMYAANQAKKGQALGGAAGMGAAALL